MAATDDRLLSAAEEIHLAKRIERDADLSDRAAAQLRAVLAAGERRSLRRR